MWNIVTGLLMCRKIEAAISQHGYHAALGGGVMKHSASEKDLDVMIYPHKGNGDLRECADLVKSLEVLNGYEFKTADFKEYDTKCVIIADNGKRRIDIFLFTNYP